METLIIILIVFAIIISLFAIYYIIRDMIYERKYGRYNDKEDISNDKEIAYVNQKETEDENQKKSENKKEN